MGDFIQKSLIITEFDLYEYDLPELKGKDLDGIQDYYDKLLYENDCTSVWIKIGDEWYGFHESQTRKLAEFIMSKFLKKGGKNVKNNR